MTLYRINSLVFPLNSDRLRYNIRPGHKISLKITQNRLSSELHNIKRLGCKIDSIEALNNSDKTITKNLELEPIETNENSSDSPKIAPDNNINKSSSTLPIIERLFSGFQFVIKSNFARVYLLRGMFYYKLQKNTLALTNYDRAIDLNPNSALAYYYRGKLYYQLEKFQLALNDFDRAIQIEPNLATSYLNRGQILLALHNK
ncbi:MAG: tetratricopeptide repeat protein [Prochloraceae cyanobacterium]